MTQLDLAFVRSQFPAFSEPSLEGWAHFENAGGSFTCRHVIEHLETFYRQTKVQPYFDYPASQAAGTAMDHAYEVLAAWMNVPDRGSPHWSVDDSKHIRARCSISRNPVGGR